MFDGGTFRVGATAAPPATDAYGIALRDAYQQGFDDALAGLDPRPPRHIPMPQQFDGAASGGNGKSSGFGIGSLFKYGMAAQYAYKLGCGPAGWSLQTALINAKTNPLQCVMLLTMFSGILF